MRWAGESRLRARRRGLSLVGVLVASMLLTAVLIPMFMLFQQSRQSTSNSIHSIVAAQLIGTQIEKMRALPFRRLERRIVSPGRPEPQPGVPDVPDIISGPFERDPELPDIVEEGLLTSGGVTFDRLTYIAYFPFGNPDPARPDFYSLRQRIRVRVLVRWTESGAGGVKQPRRLAIATIVQNEGYQPKPSLGMGGRR